MDLRTKLVFAFVSVSLASMLALGWLTYGPARDAWREGALNGLEALAESKKSDIERVVVAWRDQVRLIASRTQLRSITAEYDRTHDPARVTALGRILLDAQDAVQGSAVQEITVYDTHQHAIGTTLEVGADGVADLPVDWLPGQAVVRLVDLSMAGGEYSVTLTGPVTVDDIVVGTMLVRMSAEQLLEVTSDYDGLGRSGETLLARAADDGTVEFIGRPRHEPPQTPLQVAGGRQPVVRALIGTDSTTFRGAIDYRGEEVWAATRYLPELDAGLVVKVDRVEQEAPLDELRGTTVRLALGLSAFAILAAVFMGLSFASPIHQLAEVAEEIHEGNYRVRAPVRREDEIGRLAFLFNRMADSLTRSNRELRSQIAHHDRAPSTEEHEGLLGTEGEAAGSAPGEDHDVAGEP